MPSKRRCPTCGSKQWHKEPSSGMITCSEGHVLQNYRNESKETENIGLHMMYKRTLRKNKQKKDTSSKADPKLYHGAKGRYLYFQCLQLLLRLQIDALTTLWKLPPLFEVVCRDFWALNLCLLSQPIPGEAQEADHSNTLTVDTPEPDGQNPKNRDKPLETGAESDNDGSDLEKFLDENSGSSSVSEDEMVQKEETQGTSQSKARRGKIQDQEGAPITIALLVVTCWMLRVPVVYQDFINAIENYELPYLDCTRLFTIDMTSHLTKHSMQALTPHHAPAVLVIHSISRRLAKRIHSTYGITIPEASAGPILWRAVCSMGGTPTFYMLAKRLSQVLALPLTLYTLPNAENYQYDDAPVEVAFTAVIVMVLKMVYGLDGQRRAPRNSSDPVCSLPSIEEYMTYLRSINNQDISLFDSRKTLPVGCLGEGQLDEYLTFCEKALLGAKDEDSGNGILSTLFPLQKTDTRTTLEGVNHNRKTSPHQAPPIVGRETSLRPGAEYTIWSGRDVFGNVPEEYWEIIKKAARWTGVDEDYLCDVIDKYEGRLMSWWKRRSDVGGVGC
ncbi:hypothetical protein AMATHDRAFT_73927 [Amanita thiersii Skay4041]|uniref:RRN7-type domain-containing protein n=1 Tax=Amanita thiersii Skay4041 TaxID=703135 RepID=A0A2A9NY19_9AGAR|nr:hypothetical protein AMATHDRAFT_73927 [Amanita thiersii Skay4041]